MKLIPFKDCFRRRNRCFLNASYTHKGKYPIDTTTDKTVAKHENFLGCCFWNHGLDVFVLPAPTSFQLLLILTARKLLKGTLEYADNFVHSPEREVRISEWILTGCATEHILLCATICRTRWAGDRRRMPPTVWTFGRDYFMC